MRPAPGIVIPFVADETAADALLPHSNIYLPPVARRGL